MTFKKWLRGQEHREDKVGDLARDVKHDPDWPVISEKIVLQRYLEDRHACEGAVDAAAKALDEWRDSQGMNPTPRIRRH